MKSCVHKIAWLTGGVGPQQPWGIMGVMIGEVGDAH